VSGANRVPLRALALLGVAWLGVLLISVASGSHPVSLADLLAGDATSAAVVWKLRLPRVLLALLAGGGLALSGASFQTLFRNPLAEPYTLGLASGAALGAVFAVHLGAAAGGLPTISLGSLAGALAVSVLVLGLAATRKGMATSTLLLAGFAVSLSCSAVMLFVVTFVGFWIHLYSVGYMGHEEGYRRYFSYLNLFMGAMLLLILGSNYLVLFVGWEGVGLCSYLLIGYYFEEAFPPVAGKKAFIVNRIGDFGFLLGLFAIWSTWGTLHFGELSERILAAIEENR